MTQQLDILANSKWKSAPILNRVAKIEATVSKIEEHYVVSAIPTTDIDGNYLITVTYKE